MIYDQAGTGTEVDIYHRELLGISSEPGNATV